MDHFIGHLSPAQLRVLQATITGGVAAAKGFGGVALLETTGRHMFEVAKERFRNRAKNWWFPGSAGRRADIFEHKLNEINYRHQIGQISTARRDRLWNKARFDNWQQHRKVGTPFGDPDDREGYEDVDPDDPQLFFQPWRYKGLGKPKTPRFIIGRRSYGSRHYGYSHATTLRKRKRQRKGYAWFHS